MKQRQTVNSRLVLSDNCAREVDVNKAGEGELVIMINKGAVPNTVRMISSGVFNVSFVPQEPKPHAVDIKFNSTPLPGETTVYCYSVCLLCAGSVK